jgi:hypothetical protein
MKVEGRKMNRIDLINKTPMEDLRPVDFFMIRSGFDWWSRLRWNKLVEWLDYETKVALSNDPNRAAIARWVCRGLELPKARRKVQIDLQVQDSFHNQAAEHKKLLDVIG